MLAVMTTIAGVLSKWERRNVQLVSLAGLALSLALVVVMPFSGRPRAQASAEGSAHVRLPRPRPVLVLPAPGTTARENRAILHAARTIPVVRSGGGHRRLVALTFDDGPNPQTMRLIKRLERLHAPATFFQVGKMLDLYPAVGAAETARPDLFAIGDHTYDHAAMGRLPRRTQEEEIARAATTMRAHGEQAPRLFRPPYMSYDDDTHRILRARGMAMITWSVDSEDYRRPGVKQIVRNVLSAVHPGAIVLMHDGGGPRDETIDAVPRIVRALRREGYGLVTVPKLLVEDPPQPQPQPQP